MAAWRAGLAAVAPGPATARALAARPDLDLCDPRLLIVAAGKAAAPMLAAAFGFAATRGARAIAVVPEDADTAGLQDHATVIRAGHPLPDAGSEQAAKCVLDEARRLGPGDRLLVLLSGGASALLETPLAPLTLEDLRRANHVLVESGLAIGRINLVRGCLSAIKAGRLAQAARPAAVTTLAISDVEHDDPAVIGSGPTVVPVGSRREQCRSAIEALGASLTRLPRAVAAFLEEQASRDSDADDAHMIDAGDYTVIASASTAARRAEDELRARGYDIASHAAGARLYGSTEAAAARILRRLQSPHAGPSGVVVAGETTVEVTSRDPGRGGRNLDLAARLALAIRDEREIVIVAAGTDGRDGSSRAAGAVIDGGSAERAAAAGFPLEKALRDFDAEPALERAGALFVTGATGTNVGDLVVALAGARV